MLLSRVVGVVAGAVLLAIAPVVPTHAQEVPPVDPAVAPMVDGLDSAPAVERDPVAYAIGACLILPPPGRLDCNLVRKGDPTGVLRFEMALHPEGTTVWWKKYADCLDCYIPHNRSVTVDFWWLVEVSLDAGSTWTAVDASSSSCPLTSRSLWCGRPARSWDCPRELGHAAIIRAFGGATSAEPGIRDSPEYTAEHVCN
jgi:hypothetical protein